MRGELERSPLVLAAALGAALACGSCSLTSVTDFTLPTCEDDSDCQQVNEALQDDMAIPAGCRPWVCMQNRCVDLRTRSRDPDNPDREKCDGFDNDCDQVVDETHRAPEGEGRVQTLTLPEPDRLVEDATETAGIAYGVAESGRGAVAWTNPVTSGRGARAQFAAFGDTVAEMGYRTNASETNLSDTDLTSGCRILPNPDEETTVLGTCGFGEVALDIVDDGELRVLAANVAVQGCTAGQVRVGHFTLGNAPGVIERGPPRRSSSYVGIDPTFGDTGKDFAGRCTGGSRPACADAISLVQQVGESCGDVADCGGDAAAVDCVGGTCMEVGSELQDRVRDSCGVSRVALGALGPREMNRPQALVGWIADAFSREDGTPTFRGECGGEEADVEVMGIYLEDGAREGGFNWVTATNEGLPQALGTTTGGGAPAIGAVGGEGYVVGYRSAASGDEGSLALQFVGAAPDVPDYDGQSCCQRTIGAECTSDGDCGGDAFGCGGFCRDPSTTCSDAPMCTGADAPFCSDNLIKRCRETGETCVRDDDCSGADNRCVNGAKWCTDTGEPCLKPEDCTGAGNDCESQCVDSRRRTVGASCAADSDCPSGFVCELRRCLTNDNGCELGGDPQSALCTGAQDRSGVETGPLPEPVALGPFGPANGGPVDHVAIEVGPIENDSVRVGVAWREGCGTPSDSIAFRQIVLDLAGGTVSVQDAGEAVVLSSDGLRVGPPALGYVPDGLVAPGFQPEGADAPAGPSETGGWWVAWSQAPGTGDPGRVVARRIAALGGGLVDDEEVIDVTAELGAAPNGVSPSVSVDPDGDPRVAYVDENNAVVVGRKLTCSNTTPADGGEE